MATVARATERLFGLLGIAQRAGALITGTALVLKAIQSHRVALVVMAADTGAATKKKVTDKGRFYSVPVLEFGTRETLSRAIGKERSLIGVTQAGFAKKIKEINQLKTRE